MKSKERKKRAFALETWLTLMLESLPIKNEVWLHFVNRTL
jgi:hypothetical protein